MSPPRSMCLAIFFLFAPFLFLLERHSPLPLFAPQAGRRPTPEDPMRCNPHTPLRLRDFSLLRPHARIYQAVVSISFSAFSSSYNTRTTSERRGAAHQVLYIPASRALPVFCGWVMRQAMAKYVLYVYLNYSIIDPMIQVLLGIIQYYRPGDDIQVTW